MNIASSKEPINKLENKAKVIKDNETYYKDIRDFDTTEQTTYQKKIVQIKRVIKVVKGGKLLSYRTIVLTGDSVNGAGFGVGKAKELKIALIKAETDSYKNFVKIPLTLSESIPYASIAKYGASQILLKPAKKGTGIIASGAIRYLLKFIGIKNIITKQLGSNNVLNNLKATVLALKRIRNKAFFLSNFKNKYYTV